MNIDRWIALISLGITFGAIAFSVWAYKRSVKHRTPTIVSTPNPEVLIKKVISGFRGFSVTHDGVAIGRNDVTAFFIYFWNDGDLPLLKSDVILPYSVSFPKDVKILDFLVVKLTRDVLGIKTTKVVNEEEERIDIDFAVLEPGDGLKLQIIVDGPADLEMKYSGSCIGSAKVRVLPPDWTYFTSRRKRFEATYIPLASTLILTTAASILGLTLNFLWKLIPASLNRYLLMASLICALIPVVWFMVLLFQGWYKQWSATTVPPEIRSS